MDIATHLSVTLKTLRQARGWSLTQTAEVTGVSKAMLGQIERNESSPTVATLWKIATGFNVPLSRFITPPTQTRRPEYDPQQQAMVIRPLFPYDDQLHFDAFALRLAPGAVSESTPHGAGVIEHVVVIEGILTLTVGGVCHQIGAGEGRRFAGDQSHSYHNQQDGDVLFHSLIHYPAGK